MATSNANQKQQAQAPDGVIPPPKPFNDPRFINLKSWLDASKTQLAAALPRHLSVDRLIRISLTTVRRTPDLLDCTIESFLGSIMQAAQLGLEPDGLLGEAYLIPYFNKYLNRYICQLIPGYRGLLKLARNSGQVMTIDAAAVFQGDEFQFERGLNPKLIHIPNDGDDDPAKITHFYAIAGLLNGGKQFEVMKRVKIERIRTRSPSSRRSDSPWVTDYEPMGKKTVLRQLCKLVPSSVERDALAKAVMLDERLDAALPQVFDDQIQQAIENANPPATGETGPAEPPPAPAAAPAGLSSVAAKAKADRERRSARRSGPTAAPAPADDDPMAPPAWMGDVPPPEDPRK